MTTYSADAGKVLKLEKRLSLAKEVAPMETSELYQLINRATAKSFRRALQFVDKLSNIDMRQKTLAGGNTYLHFVILSLAQLGRNNGGDIRPAIPLIYKLALKGCDPNVQNGQGNTCLHLACFRPHGEKVVQHLVRIGVDPALVNASGFRVIHDNATHRCWLVSGQKTAACSMWMAVQREDTDRIELYMRSWCRVLTRRKRKTLIDVAYDTGNYRTVERLLKYQNTNELVVAALACDTEKVGELLALKWEEDAINEPEKCDLMTCDRSLPIAKPLLAELLELGSVTNGVVRLLRGGGAMSEVSYLDAVEAAKFEFTNTEFYKLVEESTAATLDAAWQLANRHEFNINARRADGATYLHLLVEKYHSSPDLATKRQLIRLMYKLVLEGIDVHQRNCMGETVLVAAYREPPDRILLDHIIQMGVDAAIRSANGSCVSINTYATRGDLLLQPQLNRVFLPGLWTAVEDSDITRVRFWLANLCRVNTSKGGRTLIEYAKDRGLVEIASLLEEYQHLTEFATSAMAGDVIKMKYHLAMGDGVKKVNACYAHYFAGKTGDWKTEFVVRPLTVNIMEYCPAEVIRFVIEFGAKMEVHYEECAPCGPVAFWAFRDDIEGPVSLVVAELADLRMRDERGTTLLHKAVLKKDSVENKKKVVGVMLERGADVAARDLEGLTPRDYCLLETTVNGRPLVQLIDDHVLSLAYIGDYDSLEQLVIEGYDHLNDICGTERQKTARELAYLRYYKELIILLDEMPQYQSEIEQLHAAVVRNDTKVFVRLASEKKVAWGVDKRGRTILHLAVLFRRADLVSTICEQFSQMIYQGDCLLRTPVHYAVTLKDQRATLSLISTSNTVDLTLRDANNLSVLDYIDQLDRPVPLKAKPRGRRHYNYDVRDLIKVEKAAIPVEEQDLSSHSGDAKTFCESSNQPDETAELRERPKTVG